MVSLSGAVIIYLLKVHNSAGAAVMLRHSKHSRTPSSWCVDWHLFNNSQANISVKASLNLSVPVQGDSCRIVSCYRFRFFVNK